VSALGGGDLEGAPERARRAIERVKQLESELGKIRKGERGGATDALAQVATLVDGVTLVVAEVPGEDADGLRELAQALRGKFDATEGAIVLGNAQGERALLVGACTNALVSRGVTAPLLLENAARAVGGGAGGKPILAFAGGKDSDALGGALHAIPDRLRELLAGA